MSKSINKWYEAHVELNESVLIPEEYIEPLYDDLNTPGYIANLHKLFDKAQQGETKIKNFYISM